MFLKYDLDYCTLIRGTRCRVPCTKLSAVGAGTRNLNGSALGGEFSEAKPGTFFKDCKSTIFLKFY